MSETALDVLVREHGDLQEHFAQVRDPDADRRAAWLETVKLMSAHVAVERSFVYPIVKRRRLGSTHLGDLLIHDYRSMEHLLVLTERRKVNSPDMPELVTKLLEVFDEHLARCENELIPALRESLDRSELDELGAKMDAAESVIVSHPHPHLLALGPLYRLTTRFASRWDRTRDRLVRNRQQLMCGQLAVFRVARLDDHDSARLLADYEAELASQDIVLDNREGGGVGAEEMVALLARLEEEARVLGCRRSRLDTGPRMATALSLYTAVGYREIPDYNGNPHAAHCMEKIL